MSLKKYRKAKGLTQEQLASNLGLTQGAVQRWEAGSRQIPYHMVATIAKFLDVEPTKILFDVVPTCKIPLCGWVNAGSINEIEDIISKGLHPMKTLDIANADPKRHIALFVRGDSMNRIAPEGAIIVVDISEKALANGSIYVFSSDDGTVSFKIFKDNPSRLEPYSTNSQHEVAFPTEPISVIGKVITIQINLED